MTKIIKTFVVMNALIISGLLATQSHAASACKGLESAACASNAQCGWVAAYERKDGREVKAFCRTKAKRSANKVSNSSSNSLLGKVAKTN